MNTPFPTRNLPLSAMRPLSTTFTLLPPRCVVAGAVQLSVRRCYALSMNQAFLMVCLLTLALKATAADPPIPSVEVDFIAMDEGE